VNLRYRPPYCCAAGSLVALSIETASLPLCLMFLHSIHLLAAASVPVIKPSGRSGWPCHCRDEETAWLALSDRRGSANDGWRDGEQPSLAKRLTRADMDCKGIGGAATFLLFSNTGSWAICMQDTEHVDRHGGNGMAGRAAMVGENALAAALNHPFSLSASIGFPITFKPAFAAKAAPCPRHGETRTASATCEKGVCCLVVLSCKRRVTTTRRGSRRDKTGVA